MAEWDVVSEAPAQNEIPKGRAGAPKVGEQSPGGGTYVGVVSGEPRALPPEAGALYSRVRRAEGTAAGDGFVYYGGDRFKPGAEHPGDAAKRNSPNGETHAAGPGQWQQTTWDGLKPTFRERFGRDPVFSSDDDQKAMVWLKAAQRYGGEDKLRADIASGKLDESKLAGEWEGFKGRRGSSEWSVAGSGKWRVNDNAIAYEQARGNTSVVWMSPEDYLAMTPETSGGEKRKSLLKSLGLGEPIESIPSLDAKMDGSRLKVFDQDGRNRARVAKEEGVEAIPVAVHGVSGEMPAWIEDMRGTMRRFDFDPVAPTKGVPPSRVDRFGTGAADVGVGAAQLAAHTGMVDPQAAPYLPPEALSSITSGETATAIDKGVAERERGIQADRASRGETGTDWWRVAGKTAMTLPLGIVPGAGAAGAGVGALARIGGAVAGGAISGAAGAAVEPVTQGPYAPSKAAQIGEAALTGAALGPAANVIGAGARAVGNAVGRVVSPSTITRAASRLFGEDTKKLTEGKIADIKDRLAATFQRIEASHEIDLGKDTKLVPALDLIKAEARSTLGDPNYGGRSGAVVTAIDNLLSLADANAVIPGKAAATLWHQGGAIDRLTKNADPAIRQFGQEIKTAARDAFNRVLPPDDAAVYSATRNQWRDMKIVEKAIPTGQHEVRPRQLVQRVRQRFPNEKEMRNPPEVVKLARAVGETWPMGDTTALAARTAARTARAIAGGALGHVLGGPIGGGIGIAGELALERLMRDKRIASRNAMRAFLPSPAPPAPRNAMMDALRGMAQRVPTVAAAPLGAAMAAP